MDNDKLTRRIIISMTASTLLIALIFTKYYWQQIAGFVLPIVGTFIFLLTTFVVVKVVFTLIFVFKQRKNLSFKTMSPSIIYALALILVVLNPQTFHAEHYQSAIKYRGCYEGTVNTGVIKFRVDGTFEYQHVGVFAISTFEKGIWTQSGDTLIINISHEYFDRFILTGDGFIKIQGDSTLDERIRFYRGYCKGLN